MTFPTETNGLASVAGTATLAAAGHAARHNELKAGIESIRDVLGGSAVPSGTVRIDATTLASAGHGVRIRGGSGDTSAILQFTNFAGDDEWSRIAAPSDSVISMLTAGTERLRVETGGVASAVPLSAVTVAASGYGVRVRPPSGDATAGIVQFTNNAQSAQWATIESAASGNLYLNAQVTVPAGSATGPAIAATGDTNTGMYFPAADSVALTTAGTARLTVGTAGQVTTGLGTVGAPVLSFNGDTNTGIYSPGADSFAIATAGTARLSIDSAGLITGTGTSLGSWTSYSPSWTGLTVGDGTLNARYMRLGKMVHVNIHLIFGSTTSITGAGVSLPVAVAYRGAGATIFYDNSVDKDYVGGIWLEGSNGYIDYGSSRISATVPFTWATSDQLMISATYEVS